MRKVIVVLIAVFTIGVLAACGGSATPTAVPPAATPIPAATAVPAAAATAVPAAPAAAAAPAATATPRPTAAPAATSAPAVVVSPIGGQILKGVKLIELDIRELPFQSPRGSSHGTLTVGWHFSWAPRWLDPQEMGGTVFHQAFQSLTQDAMIKPSGEGYFSYSLAELAELSVDYTQAGFRLREGLVFQDGVPITTEAVKWNYENYKGVSATQLQDKLDRIEIVNDRDIIFHFKEPFIDFMLEYNAFPNGAGWIVPPHYYEAVGGHEGFIANPMGAGPFKFVKMEPGNTLEVEAWDGYWRRVPGVQKLVMTVVPGFEGRLAALRTGEVDVTWGLAGGVLREVIDDPNLRWDANFTNPWHIFFPGYEDPDSPWNDKRVRQAVSLGINRAFLSEQQVAGLGPVWGNWIGPDRLNTLTSPGELPLPEYDRDAALALLAEAGFGPDNPIEYDGFASFPPYHPMSEQQVTDLSALGIMGDVEVMDQPVFNGKMGQGREGWSEGNFLVNQIVVAPGSASADIGYHMICDSPASFICEPYIEERWEQFNASLDLEERSRLLKEIQRYAIEEYLVVPTFINPFVHAIGTNVLPEGDAAPGEGFHKYWASPQVAFPWPWEDWEVKN